VIAVADVRRAVGAIADRVTQILSAGERPLLVGGDCTLLLGVFEGLPAGSGLWFVDGHADYFDGQSSPTGEGADMELAILTGAGPRGIVEPRLDPGSVVLLGHRPSTLGPDVARENARLDPAVYALTAPDVRARGPDGVGRAAARRLAGAPAWLHLDLDVLDADVLPAVSYPQPLGLDWSELATLTRPLLAAKELVGISVADFNPDRDPDGEHARRVVEELSGVLTAQ